MHAEEALGGATVICSSISARDRDVILYHAHEAAANWDLNNEQSLPKGTGYVVQSRSRLRPRRGGEKDGAFNVKSSIARS
jgi:hypothetical protein